MRPRRLPWKWLLAALVLVVAAGIALVLSARLGGSSEFRDQVAASLSAWTGGTVTLTEPLRVRYFPPSLRGGVVVSNAEKLPGIKTVTAPDFKVTLGFPAFFTGRVQLDTLMLGKPTISLEQDPEEKTGVRPVSERLTSLLDEMPVDTIRIRRGKIVTADGKNVVRKLDVRLNVRGQKGALTVLGSLNFNDETVAFSIDSGTIKTSPQGSAPVTLKISSRPLTAKFSGTARTEDQLEATGSMEAELPDVRQFLNWIGVGVPDGRSLQNVTASGTAHWSGQTLTFDDGAFEFDGNEAVGLFAATAGARPRVEGTLAFETLNLDPYLSSGVGALLDWDWFRVVDADLRISAGQFAGKGVPLGRGGFTVNAKDGKISTEVGELEMCKGHASGRLELDLTGAEANAALTGSLADIEIQSCLKPFAPDVPVKGRGTVRFDVSTAAGGARPALRALTGDVEVVAQDGVIPIDFEALAETEPTQVHGWSAEEGMAFDALDADCSLSAGHLWCHSVRLEAKDNLVSGSGGLDMTQQTLDWDFLMADPVSPVDASLWVPEGQARITLDGPLSAPRIQKAKRPDQEPKTPNPEGPSAATR